MNQNGYAIAAAACSNESYRELVPLFEGIELAALDKIQVVYVDKCCGPGSFGAAILQACPDATIKLDLAHWLRRMPASRLKELVQMRTEIGKALWYLLPEYRDTKDPPACAWRVRSDGATLAADIEAIMQAYRLKLAALGGLPKEWDDWWKNAKPHIENNCLGDEEGLSMYIQLPSGKWVT